jgi:hypothetical protein
MAGRDAMAMAETVLGVHLLVIGFNVFGLVATPVGAWLGWRFVRIAWWRWLHLASMGLVAVQALVGRICMLTLWQAQLAGEAPTPLIMGWVNRLIYWPLPLWAFTAAYAVLFAYAVALMALVPTRPTRRAALRARDGAGLAPPS